MALEVINRRPNGEVTNKIVKDGDKNNRYTDGCIVECNGKEEAGTVSIRVPHHFIKIDLEKQFVLIKDLGIEIRAK